MSGVITTIPKLQFIDANGNPLVLGTIDVYLAGTTTPTPTWQDFALSTLNTNPIELDVRGEATIWLDSAVTYKFVLKNAAGATQWTVDNISGADSGLRDALAASSGASLVGYLPAGTGAVASTVQDDLRGIEYGSKNIGPYDQRVLNYGATHAGPFISRPAATSADIILFVDPLIGSDANAGTLSAAPLQTINAALQKVPQAIYHKVRIYLLDGDYSNQQILIFNYYITASSKAGFKIIGHVTSVDGEAHPMGYLTDDPDLVKFGVASATTNQHVISGIYGSEELTIAGVRFENSWVECYSCYLNLDRCNFDTGFIEPGYEPKICIGGHYYWLKLVTCDFQNCNCVIDAEGHANAIIENCTVSGMIVGAETGLEWGYPVYARNGSSIYIKNSPTFNATHAGGRNVSRNGSEIFDSKYSSVGSVNWLARDNAAADESLQIQGGNGVVVGGKRGSGAAFYGRNHATTPGGALIEFGPATTARAIVRHYSDADVATNSLTVFPTGEIAAKGGTAFGPLIGDKNVVLANGQAVLYTGANGDTFIISKRLADGVTRYTKISDFATATAI